MLYIESHSSMIKYKHIIDTHSVNDFLLCPISGKKTLLCTKLSLQAKYCILIDIPFVYNRFGFQSIKNKPPRRLNASSILAEIISIKDTVSTILLARTEM